MRESTLYARVWARPLACAALTGSALRGRSVLVPGYYVKGVLLADRYLRDNVCVSWPTAPASASKASGSVVDRELEPRLAYL